MSYSWIFRYTIALREQVEKLEVLKVMQMLRLLCE